MLSYREPKKRMSFLNKSHLLILALFCIFVSLDMPDVFAHGLGSETMPPVLLGNRNVTLAVGESQLTPDSTKSSKIIAMTLLETDTKKPVKDVTFHVVASRHDQVLFDYTFQRNNGDLDIDIITTDQKEVRIKEEYGANWLGQIVGSPSNLAIITGPIFGRGGLYDFKVEILTADSYSNKLDPPIVYDVGLSIPDTSSYNVIDSNNFEQKVGVITYYDQISDFEFDSQDNEMRFVMPFDWSDKNLNQVTVVHEEISIPKSFGDFLSSKYYAYVNGIKLDESSVIIDDYSKPERLVHIVVNQNDLASLKKTAAAEQKMEFILQPSSEKSSLLTYTKNFQYAITLTHYPDPLIAGSDASFLFEIKEIPQNKTISIPYDFFIKQNDRMIFQKSGITEITETEIDVQIPDNVSGPINLQFENIGSNKYATAELPLVIKKAEENQSSTISLFSFTKMGDNISKGAYRVDLAWFPDSLRVDKYSKFAFTVRDVGTGVPMPDAYYEFVILQNGEEKVRKSGFAVNGSDSVDHLFENGQQGTYLVRIENINRSGQQAEIPITVTPEFPAGLMMVLAAPILFIFVMKKLKRV